MTSPMTRFRSEADMTTHPAPAALPELVERALNQAYALGQKYWQQADSESHSQNRKADETDSRFTQLRTDTLAALPLNGTPGSVAERIDIAALEEQSEAWFAVCRALDKAAPGWCSCKTKASAIQLAESAIAALAQQPKAEASPVTVLPDGSAFSTMTFPLPKDHWLTAEGYNIPPMPMRMGVGSERNTMAEKVRAAARYAVRASTMNGAEDDFDPDAMVQNMVVGLLGYWTADGANGEVDSTGTPLFDPVPLPPLYLAPPQPQPSVDWAAMDEFGARLLNVSHILSGAGGTKKVEGPLWMHVMGLHEDLLKWIDSQREGA